MMKASPRVNEKCGEWVVQGYFLGSYSARKLGRHNRKRRGNHNLILDNGAGLEFSALLRK